MLSHPVSTLNKLKAVTRTLALKQRDAKYRPPNTFSASALKRSELIKYSCASALASASKRGRHVLLEPS